MLPTSSKNHLRFFFQKQNAPWLKGLSGLVLGYKYTTALMTAPRLHLSTEMMYKNQQNKSAQL